LASSYPQAIAALPAIDECARQRSRQAEPLIHRAKEHGTRVAAAVGLIELRHHQIREQTIEANRVRRASITHKKASDP